MERACGIIVRMNNERSEHSRAWMEARRLRAWELLQKGWKQIEVAEALGVSRRAVGRWAALARQEGCQALRRRKPPGGPRKLKDGQLAQLPVLLEQGPSASVAALALILDMRFSGLLDRLYQAVDNGEAVLAIRQSRD